MESAKRKLAISIVGQLSSAKEYHSRQIKDDLERRFKAIETGATRDGISVTAAELEEVAAELWDQILADKASLEAFANS